MTALTAASGLVLILGFGVVDWLDPRSTAELEIAYRPKGDLRFDSDRWKSSNDASLRYRMADDLILSTVLIGMTSEQVAELLYPEDKRPRMTKRARYMGYPLANQSDFPARSWLHPNLLLWNLDVWLLSITFTDGVVSEFQIDMT